MASYISTLFQEPIAFFDQAIYRILAVLIGLCFHEFGHAYVAHLCGDDTAKNMGRMTINPLAHLDPVGTILMFFAGVGYAKPVPVNPYNFKGNRVRSDLLVSLAGICMNLILLILFTILTVLCSSFMWNKEVIRYYGLSSLVSYRYNVIWSVIEGKAADMFGQYIAAPALIPFVRLFAYTAIINLNLAVFNLIPLPPLDGYHVFNDLIFKGRFQLSRNATYIALGLVLILSYTGVFGRIISAVIYPVQDLLLLPVKAIWG
ncbi:MAG: site-2 protease family protein [Clostridia bacterium]|nr:site-2 protease family protein [Clostridia bacterium]